LDVLRRQGFHPERPLPPSALAHLLRIDSEYPLVSGPGALRIDLQWKIRAQPLFIDPELNGAWERTVEEPCGDLVLKQWAWPDEVIFLCLHGFKHRWIAWEWLISLAQTLTRGTPSEWPELDRIAGQSDVMRVVALGLYLVHFLLRVEIPAAWSARAETDRDLQELAAKIINRLVRTGTSEAAGEASWSWLDYWRLADHSSLGARALWRWLVVPSVLDLEQFPEVPFIFLFGLRPIRLVLKTLKR
jgi:hypothetical protein